MRMFPVNVEIGQVRGIVSTIKGRGKKGSIYIGALTKASGMDVGSLLPVLEACRLLGLVRMDEGTVALTKSGRELTLENLQKVLKASLRKTEPFRSVLRELRTHGSMTTRELIDALNSDGILLRSTASESSVMLKRLLLHWGIASLLVLYDIRSDSWKRV